MKRNYLLLGISMVFILMVVCISCDKDDKKDDEAKYESEIDDFLKSDDNDNVDLAGATWKVTQIQGSCYEEEERKDSCYNEDYEGHYLSFESSTECGWVGDDYEYTYQNGNLKLSRIDDDRDDYYREETYEGPFSIKGDIATWNFKNKHSAKWNEYDKDDYYGRFSGRKGCSNSMEEGKLTFRLTDGEIGSDGSLIGTSWEYIDVKGIVEWIDKDTSKIKYTSHFGGEGEITFQLKTAYFYEDDKSIYDYVYKDGRLVIKREYTNNGEHDYNYDAIYQCTYIYDGNLLVKGNTAIYDYTCTYKEEGTKISDKHYYGLETEKDVATVTLKRQD